jgi:uncharacterized membrane protein YhfC
MGEFPYHVAVTSMRLASPGIYLLALLACAACAGIPIGIVVLKGTSFQQRIMYGIIAAPLFLTIGDILRMSLQINIMKYNPYTWDYVFWTLISNLFGGAVAGLLIGATAHLYAELLQRRATSGPRP